MENISYIIGKEFKNPIFGKPYIEYRLIREYDYFDYDPLSCWGETVRLGKVIFKSKDKVAVESFLKELLEE